MSEFPTKSTYVAPVTITDRDGDPLSLSGAEIEYALSEYESGGELYSASDGDSAVEIEPSGETGVVRVTVPATEITWKGRVWEELRVRQPDASVAVLKRQVRFSQVATEAQR